MMYGVDAFEDSRRIEKSYAISHSSKEDTYDWDADMAEFMTDTKDETVSEIKETMTSMYSHFVNDDRAVQRAVQLCTARP